MKKEKKKGKGKKGGEEKKSSKSELISPLLSGPFFPTEDVRRHAHQSNNRPRYRGEPVSEYSSIGIERGGIRRFRKESTTYCRVDSYYARKGGQREEFRRILTRIIICDSCNRATMEARATFYRSRFGKKKRRKKKRRRKEEYLL